MWWVFVCCKLYLQSKCILAVSPRNTGYRNCSAPLRPGSCNSLLLMKTLDWVERNIDFVYRTSVWLVSCILERMGNPLPNHLQQIPDILVQSRTFISGITTYKTKMADFVHIKKERTKVQVIVLLGNDSLHDFCQLAILGVHYSTDSYCKYPFITL